MAAERTPHEASIFAAPLAWVSRFVLAHPRSAIVGGVLLALVSVGYAAMNLGFRTSRLDLLNPDSTWNQRWLAYLTEFGREDDAVVVIEGPDEPTVIAAVDDLAAELAREDQWFSSVFHRVDLSRIRAKGLHLAAADELTQLESFVAQAEPVLRGDWQRLSVESQLGMVAHALPQLPAESPQREQVLEQLRRLTSGLESAFAPTPSYHSPWPDGKQMQVGYGSLDDRYLLADDGRIGLVLLKLVGKSRPDEADHHPAIVRLNDVLERIEARHPDVAIGATGMPILEHDEMQTSQRDMTWTSLLSMLGVGACFWAALGGWRHAALAMAALGLSMCWAFGFVAASVGHLNLLSVSFASVLIGQGIDFGIHYVAGYLRNRQELGECDAALLQTSRTISPGIFTGGLTTAVAFCMTLLTDFTGLRELGMIAGGGILICTVGALVLLPPLIRCCDGKRPPHAMPQIVPMPLLTWPMHRLPRVTIGLVLLLTIVCGAGLFRLRYDHNLLHLQPRGLTSVELEHTLIERAERSVWFALSMHPSREALLERKKQFENLPTVSHTEEIVSLLPAASEQTQASVDNIRRVLALLPETVPQLAAPKASRVEALLGDLQSLLAAQPALASEYRRVATLKNIFAATTPADAVRRLAGFEQAASEELVVRLASLRSVADPVAPSIADLPRPLAERYIGSTGQYLLKVYARGNVWDIENLERFVQEVEGVDPQITGHPIQTYYASNQMQQSYLHAGIYAFIAMMIAVIVDLRRVRTSVIAVLPMFLGLVQTFGLLGWLGIPLNAANMIVLPLIFGIGIDDGVHLTHDFMHARGRYRLDNATFVAVMLTSVTTMVGFGSLILAQHQGLRSLGQVLTLGVLCCLVSSTTLLPALFVLWTRQRSEAPAEALVSPTTARRLDPADAIAPATAKTVPRRVTQPR